MNLLTPLKVSDQAREDRLAAQAEAKVRDARTAMEALQQRRTKASDERKAAAKQKIEQLKARLQMLQSMASSDPKGTARLAAQLARELKAAVKEYSGGGVGGFGSIGGGADTAVQAPTSGAAPATDAAAPTDAAAQAPTSTPTVTTTASGSDAEGDTSEEGKDGEGDGKAANPYQQAIDQQQARAAEFNRRTAEAQADQEFIGEARKLAAQIKALVRNATDRMQGEEGALSPEEARELKAAVSDMDRQIETAQGDLGGSISILV